MPRLLAAALLATAAAVPAADQPAVVSHVLVLSPHIEDVSSLAAWKRAMISDGMSDEEKAKRIWETVVKFRHQATPPNEFLINDGDHAHDFIKMANVYGWGQCCCASSHVEELARYLGLPARGWAATNHSIPEIQYDGRWHMLDGSLINYYLLDDGKTIAGVEDLIADPAGRVNAKHAPLVENGWYPAHTHEVKNSPATYTRKGDAPFIYEYGYSQGYEVNVQLRDGERLTRNWSNKGLHVNALEGGECWSIDQKVGEGDLCYAPKYGDIAPGRVGNGTAEYHPPVGKRIFLAAALAADNAATSEDDGKRPALHAKDPAHPATVVVRMPSSYLYLGGTLAFPAVVGQGGAIVVAFSQNNGLDWKDIATISASGAQSIDLKELVYRRYDYRLRFTLTGAGTGLDGLDITHDVLHSQRPLPALKQGANRITFSSGAQEGRITVEGNIDPAMKAKQLVMADFHPVINGIAGVPMFLQGGTGDITFPVETPGEMTRIEMGCFYRARGAGEGFDYQVSFDAGATWKTVGRAEGPTRASTVYATCAEIPKGTRSALVRFSGKQNNTLGFWHIAINASYVEPHGGFRPVQVTYRWEEDGKAKEDVHIAKQADEQYTITCAAAPLMKSLVVELAP